MTLEWVSERCSTTDPPGAHRATTWAETEWRLLELFVSQPGKLLTHQWLIARIWGAGHGGETLQTLRAHLRSLRAKLGDDSKEPRFIRTETRIGYRWVPPVATNVAPNGAAADGG